MTNTTETSFNYTPTFDTDRETFLDENDRGFEVKVDEKAARDMARASFIALTNQLESGHNID